MLRSESITYHANKNCIQPTSNNVIHIFKECMHGTVGCIRSRQFIQVSKLYGEFWSSNVGMKKDTKDERRAGRERCAGSELARAKNGKWRWIWSGFKPRFLGFGNLRINYQLKMLKKKKIVRYEIRNWNNSTNQQAAAPARSMMSHQILT